MSDPVRAEYDPFAPVEEGPVGLEYDENTEESSDDTPAQGAEGAKVDYNSMNKAELVDAAKAAGVAHSGTKADLVAALEEYDQE